MTVVVIVVIGLALATLILLVARRAVKTTVTALKEPIELVDAHIDELEMLIRERGLDPLQDEADLIGGEKP